MAQLPPVGHEQFYSILAANDEMVFMHVDEPGGQFLQNSHPLFQLTNSKNLPPKCCVCVCELICVSFL